MSISVCICTYDRAAELALTLESIAGAVDWFQAGDELVVVNNNASDQTDEVVQTYMSKLPVRIVHESVQGLSAARNRALAEYSGDAMIFFDDDITVSKATLDSYRRALESMPRYDFFGGQIEVLWQDGAPPWLRSDTMPLIAGFIGRYAPEDADDDSSHSPIEWPGTSLLPYGANFALRRALTERVGEFDETLGVKGKSIGRGEETDYFLRALALGYRGRYLPDACVGHRFDKGRFRSSYLFRYGLRKGDQLTPVAGGRNEAVKQALTFATKGVWQLARGRRDRYYQSIINTGICLGRTPRH